MASSGCTGFERGGPWGQVARIGPASIPVWVLDPDVILAEVATDVREIMETATLAQAEKIYRRLGHLPESGIVRMVDFRRPPPG